MPSVPVRIVTQKAINDPTKPTQKDKYCVFSHVCSYVCAYVGVSTYRSEN